MRAAPILSGPDRTSHRFERAPDHEVSSAARSKRVLWFAAVALWLGCVGAMTLDVGMLVFWIAAGVSALIVLVGLRGELRSGGMLFLAVSVGLAAGPNNTTNGNQFQAALVVSAGLLLALLLSFSGAKLPRRHRSPAFIAVVAAAILFLALEYFSSAANESANLTYVFVRFVLPSLLALLVCLRLRAGGARLFLDGVILLGVAQAVLAVLEVAKIAIPPFGPATTNGAELPHPINTELIRAQGMLGHPILLGMLLVVAMLILAFRRPRSSLWVLIAGEAVLALGAYLSGSRSAWAIGAVCLIFALVSERASVVAKMFLAIALVAVLSFALLDQRAFSLIAGQWDRFSESGSYSHRADFWTYVGQLANLRSSSEVLFGSGVGSELELFNRGLLQQDGFQVVDNQFLTTLATIGIAGAFALVVLSLVGAFRLRGGARLAFISLCLMFFIFDELRWLGPPILFFSLLGLVGIPLDARSAEAETVAEPDFAEVRA
jgi:hypothetical protein